MPKFVIGHSWGGYAAASVLALHSEIKAAALLAPMNSGADIMLEKAEEYAGKIVYTTKPIIDIYQDILFGDYANYDGVKGINSTNIPVLIAQGVDDTTITPDKQSITAHLDKITNPNVYVYWGKGHQATHTGIWHSKEAEEYRLSVNNQINDLQEQLGSGATESELAQFYSSIDHKLYSDVNAELIDLIISTFAKGLKL